VVPSPKHQSPKRRSLNAKVGDAAMIVATLSAVLLLLLALGLLIGDVGVHAREKLSWTFISQAPQNGMMEGGIFPAILGTALLVLLMTAVSVPIGVATAIYLHEYARPGAWWTRSLRMAVQNLAGVPSIVFGLFGLGFFVQFVGGGMDKLLHDGKLVWGQPGLLWAALTLAVLTLPTTIVATEEALRQIPAAQREAAYALATSRFEVVFRLLVPQAMPGILTGGILAVGRGAGEVAPILFTGAAYFLPELPKGLDSQFMHLGYHVYVMATQSADVDASTPILYATVAVLLSLTFTLNLAAVIVRARMRRA
jgi:phosphate transport system permease protein